MFKSDKVSYMYYKVEIHWYVVSYFNNFRRNFTHFSLMIKNIYLWLNLYTHLILCICVSRCWEQLVISVQDLTGEQSFAWQIMISKSGTWLDVLLLFIMKTPSHYLQARRNKGMYLQWQEFVCIECKEVEPRRPSLALIWNKIS